MAPLGNGLGDVVRILAVLERDECLVLVEGEEVSLVFDDIDEFHAAVAWYIKNSLSIEIDTGLDVQGFNNNTDKLLKGESIVRIKLSGETVSEHVL